MIRLVADANLSRRFVEACLRLDRGFPIVHLADWMSGKHRVSNDPILLEALRGYGLILVTFDRRTMAMHAERLTRSGGGHAGAGGRGGPAWPSCTLVTVQQGSVAPKRGVPFHRHW